MTMFFLCLVSCKNDSTRVYFDFWEYSLDDKNYTPIESSELKSLEKFVAEKKGYIYVKSKAMIPHSFKLETYGLSVPRTTIASQVFLNSREIATIGSFPPNKFSNGNRYTYLILPSEIVNCGDENELKFKIYVEGKGSILGKAFIGECGDASSVTSVKNFIHSILFLLVASFMFFTGVVYLIMFLKLQHDKTMLYFSLMALSSIFFLLPSFIGNFQWALGFIDYDWFIKIFWGCFTVITAFLAASFSSEYIGLREPFYFFLFRVGLAVSGCVYCLLIPDTLHFYKFIWITVAVVVAQVIPFIPSAKIGLKMRAKIMKIMLGGNGDVSQDINVKKLPKGVPVGETVNMETNQTAEQEEAASPQEATAETSDSDKTEPPPKDDDKKEENPKVISRYGVPPPPVQKMLRDRAAEFEKKAKNPLFPKFLRKSFEERVTYFIEMSEGMREPPEFMAKMMGAPQLPPKSPQQPQPKPQPQQKTQPKPHPKPQPLPQVSVSPVLNKKEQLLSLGKANPPPVVKNILETGQIPLPSGLGAVPLAGEMDDISMAQLKYAENTIGTVKQLIIGYMPVFITLGADVILRLILNKTEVPYISLFGWQCTIVMFLFMLITNFAKIKDRGEYLSKNLRKIVYKSTEELKQKAEELEKQNKQGQKDLEMAAQVQKTFYPANPNFYGWDIAVDFKPLSSVSGDLYDFYELEGNLRGFGIFDVSGHGISSGLVTMLAKNSIFRAFRSSLSISLSEAMLRINDEIIRTKGNIENYLVGTIFRVDKNDMSKIEMVNAGNPYPILRHNKKAKLLMPKAKDIKQQHGMLGISGLDVAFKTIPFTLSDNDILVLYTDGLTEAENKEGEQYGKERLLNLISSLPLDIESDAVLENIKADFKNFIGEQPLDDDITIVVLRRIEEVAVIGDEEEGELEELEDVADE